MNLESTAKWREGWSRENEVLSWCRQEDIMDAFEVGRLIGIIIGVIGFLWLVGWISKKIK